MTEFRSELINAFNHFGVRDRSLRAGIAAICAGETGFHPGTETGYAHTHNDRIRAIFRTKCGTMSDADLNMLKADDERFFNHVYGGVNGNARVGDGYLYRGRGGNQLTGRANYARTGQRIGVDLVADPDKANDPATAALIAVDYMLSRGMQPGWTFEQMKRAVGNAVESTESVKDSAYAEFMAHGEFGGDGAQGFAEIPEHPAHPEYRAELSADDLNARFQAGASFPLKPE